MSTSIEESAYVESYQGEFDTKLIAAEKHKVIASRVNRYKHIAYATVLLLSFLVYWILPSTASFSVFGAAIIAGATLVTGCCLLICFRAQNFFSSNDPAFGSMHIKRIRDRAARERAGTLNSQGMYPYREKLSGLHIETRKETSSAIQQCVMWEMAVVTIGTLIWGFWDLFL